MLEMLRPVDSGRDLIRLGGRQDGGYLLPNDLKDVKWCFSPGVSNIAAFEADLVARGITCFLADYSVAAAPIASPQIIFEKKYLSSENNDRFMTLDAWVNSSIASEEDNLLLQMDIEGWEYEVLLSTPTSLLKRFRIIIIELHDLDKLFDQFVFRMLFKRCFDKLLTHFYVVHLHPNNCCGEVSSRGVAMPRVMEMTLYNKARQPRGAYTQEFPHALDVDNVTGKTALPLPKCWYCSDLL